MIQFATITSEGGLLPPDLLVRIASLDKTVRGLAPADYHLDEGQQHGEAISRSWSRLLPAWRSFRTELAKLPEDDPGTSVTRDRFLQPLLQELGYGRVPTAKAIDIEGKSYAITHAWGDTPIHLLGARVSLEVRTVGQAGAAKSSPHGLVQDLLNRSKPHLWALLSNGFVLRLLRDHHSLTSQAYVEVDLEAMFDGERYADFVLLWLVFHQSRVEPRDGKVDQCWLEQWFNLSRDEGLSALDDLRDGVVAAIEALGKGFLRHSKNQRLHRDLADNTLDKQDYYRELLRLAYRLIFLFSAEDRGVLLAPAAPETARDRYRRFYATRRLRDLAGTSRGGPHGDLWQALRAVMTGLDDGCPQLALPALGSFLWSREALPNLDGCQLANTELLAAIRALSYLERHKQRFPVSWRTVAADELGSIYESLLELHPRLDVGAVVFELTTAAGNERKKTGSYYTPTSLVDCLLDSALDPVIDAAANAKTRADAESALLALKIVDPACGSGHFLVAAARRLAKRLATVRTGDDEPSPSERQRALRDVVGRCIYGVDLNEMAVELCKVALWMEAVEPGKPLSFLDAHIRHGNALIGATPALIARGIPDDAWDPIEGDDKAVARALKKRNREARKAAEKAAQADMFAVVASPGAPDPLATAARDVLSGGDAAVADVRVRKRRWEDMERSAAFRAATLVANTWCAAFVWPNHEGALAAEAPTEDTFARIRKDPSTASKALEREVGKLASLYTFFHWHLAFPDVFSQRPSTNPDDILGLDGGFDCVLGNPPWERVKLQEKEFFAGKNDAIANAENAAQRKRLVAALPISDPALWDSWTRSSRNADGESHWLRHSSRYPLCGRGDVNTYSLFAELNRSLMTSTGRVGCITPPGIATDDTTKLFFSSLVDTGELSAFFEFDNEERLFAAVDHRVHFSLIGMARGRTTPSASIVFGIRRVEQLAEPSRHVDLAPEDFRLINPNTKTCPTFRSRKDAEINKAIYRRVPVLCRESDIKNSSNWNITFMRMFDMAGDSEAFKTAADCTSQGFALSGNTFVSEGSKLRLPLYEAKMIHHFDHRFGTYEGQTKSQEKQGKCPELTDADHADPTRLPHPYYWVEKSAVDSRLKDRWPHSWLLGWRDICRSGDLRTVIAAAIPRAAVGDKFLLMLPPVEHIEYSGCLLANLAALVFDFCARQKVGGTNLKYFVMKQLPMLQPELFRLMASWSDTTLLRDWITVRVIELSYTADDMAGFAATLGYYRAPFHWNSGRRALLRAELDAAFFHLYGINRDDTDYILDTFPVLRDKEVREHGEYRTKRLVLERYHALAEAIRTGIPYSSPLNPLPGDTPSVPPSREVEITPLPRRVPPRRPVPSWGQEIFADAGTRAGVALKAGAWSTTLRGEQLGKSALAAVLRGLSEPTTREEVERAVVLVLLPRLLVPHLESAMAKRWRIAISKDFALASVSALGIPWNQVLRSAVNQQVLVEDASGRWHAGPDVADVPAPVLDARALVALSWLATSPTQDTAVEQEVGDLRAVA